MVIKTLTTYDVYNYGASLQAYALMTYLARLGHNVEVINYQPDYLTRKYDYKWVNPESALSRYAITRALYRIMKYIQRQTTMGRKREFDEFNHKIIKETIRVYHTFAELCKTPPEADLFIVGSDQVWNPYITGGVDPAFFLQFGKARRRISLASSLGSHCYSEAEQEEIRGYLTSFSALSVREGHAVEQISCLTDKPVFRCLDPTLLLDRSYWQSFSKRPHGLNGTEQYILVFNLAKRSEQEERLWKQLSNQMGLPLWRINNNTYKERVFDKLLLGMTPEEFVWLIDHAKYVITDSFHGTAFSINLGTPFVSMEPILGNRARIVDLLHLLNLNGRILTADAEALPAPEIDYSGADALLEEERARCLRWLRGALDGE